MHFPGTSNSITILLHCLFLFYILKTSVASARSEAPWGCDFLLLIWAPHHLTPQQRTAPRLPHEGFDACLPKERMGQGRTADSEGLRD